MIAMLVTAAHLAALGQIESGDDDFAVGSHGEISRYQIMPKLWQEKAAGRNPRDPAVARAVAASILNSRIARYVKLHDTQPSPAAIYRLWNPRCHDETATRYANLVDEFNKHPPR